MSEENVEHKISQFPYSLEGIARMGNLFSKQEPDKKEKENTESKSETSSSSDQSGSQELLIMGDHHPDTILLNAMLNNISCAEMPPPKIWSALQHYIYFIYRHVVSVKPYNNSDNLPEIISTMIGELFDSLLEEDTTQVCLRLISLLRDYVLVAKGHIDNIKSTNVATYLVTLMAYYSALCSSAGKCAPLLPEFDFLTLGRFNINWIGVNKSVFYHHIYLSPNVQAKIPLFIKLQEENNPNLRGLLETFVCFTQDMQALATKWANLKMQITSASKSRARANPKKHLLKDWEMYSEHKKIFNSHTWLKRTSKQTNIQDMNELDAHILAWVAFKSVIPESLLNDKGCCLCENCIAAEFRNNSMAAKLAKTYLSETSAKCIVSCYICQESIILDGLIDHISLHTKISLSDEHIFPSTLPKQQTSSSQDSPTTRNKKLYEGLLEKNAQIQRSLLQLIDGTDPLRHERKKKEASSKANAKGRDKTTESSEKLKQKSTSKSGDTLFPFKQSSQSNENPFKNSKDIILKLAGESSGLQNGEESLLMEAANSNEECKIFFEQLKKLVDTNDIENGRIKTKEFFDSSANNIDSSNANKIASGTSSVKNNSISSTNDENSSPSVLESMSFRKPQQKGMGNNIDSKVLEFLKTANANAQKTASTSPPKTNDVCTGHACGHKCRSEEELKKMSCSDTCDHKDSRKCDCAYCEVFGTAFPTSAAKNSETRDRLRTRLNQRKEKGNENVESGLSKSTSTLNIRTTTKNGSNCSVKVSKTAKTPLTNGKTINVTAKVVKAVPVEPPRVPELHHPVPPPGNAKTVQVSVEVKKVTANNDKPTVSNNSKVSVACITNSTQESTLDGCSGHRSPSSLSTCSLFSESVDCRDINELLNYIEGNKSVDKVAIAHKKAAKKARQRSKKAQEKEEKERMELEKQRLKEEARLREEKIREEERRKAEAAAKKQLAEKQKKIKKDEKAAPRKEIKKGNDKKGNKTENVTKLSATTKVSIKGSKLIEETIPAMVTIKRASEGNNSQATVTITLKGSTPDTDKLLFTLVNGNENSIKENTSVPSSTNNNTTIKSKAKSNVSTNKPVQPSTTKVVTENTKPSKKKKEKENTAVNKPMKVTIAVDKHNAPKKEMAPKKNIKMDTFASHQLQQAFNNNKEYEVSNVKAQSNPKEELSLPMLNLPPGITITKIDGPTNTGGCKYSNSNNLHHNNHNQSQNPNVPSTKSGVIVVDTEKLIQQSIAASISKRDKKMNKKKRDQKTPPAKAKPPEHTKLPTPPTMVTLKNPIFETHKKTNQLPEKASLDFPSSQQASIFKRENGMVTIRSPRLQNPFETGAPVSSYFSDIQPMFTSDITSSPYVAVPQQNNYYENTNNSQFSQYNSHYHAHEFLAGLPGIEITKINKAAAESVYENKKTVEPISEPSVPTNNVVNSLNTFNFDADDWYYESVFKPRDNLEEDMDDEELELEEFKRFCHQSIPAAQKDQVNNLGVGEFVCNQKDFSYA